MATNENASSSPNGRRASERQAQQPDFSKGDSVVTFIIGPGPDPDGKTAKFIVHKEFACFYSSVLDAAFNGEFVEGQTQTYRMVDVSAGAFRMFVQWLYTQALDIKTLQGDDDEEEQIIIDDFIEQDLHLAELWVLADKLLIPVLQNCGHF